MEVTVFTSSYNHSKYLRQAIESVLDQTYQDFEYILIADGDEDSYKIMLEYKNDKVKVYKLDKQPNVGVVINKSIRLSLGDYWSWCPADDYWCPELLEIKLGYTKKYPRSVLYNNWNFIDEYGNIGENLIIKPMTSDEFAKEVWISSPIGFTGIMIPMYIFRKKNLYFPEHLNFSEDFYWMIRATIYGVPFDGIPERLHYKRRHANSNTAKNIDKILANIPIIRNELKKEKDAHT